MKKSEPKWLSESDLRLWVAFVESQSRVQRRIERQLQADAGLTQVQYEILARLGESDVGVMRMRDLSAALITSASGLTYQVTQLEKAELVERRRATNDDRGVEVSLTKVGRKLLERSAPGHVAEVRSSFLDGFSSGQRKELLVMIEQLRDRLRSLDGAD